MLHTLGGLLRSGLKQKIHPNDIAMHPDVRDALSLFRGSSPAGRRAWTHAPPRGEPVAAGVRINPGNHPLERAALHHFTYVLLPMSAVVGLVFVALGMPQTLADYATAIMLEGTEQVIALGPVAFQVASKHLGTDGSGSPRRSPSGPAIREFEVGADVPVRLPGEARALRGGVEAQAVQLGARVNQARLGGRSSGRLARQCGRGTSGTGGDAAEVGGDAPRAFGPRALGRSGHGARRR